MNHKGDCGGKRGIRKKGVGTYTYVRTKKRWERGGRGQVTFSIIEKNNKKGDTG